MASIWMGPYFQCRSIWMGWVFEMSGRTSVPTWPLGYPPPHEVTIDALSQFDAIYMIIPAYTSIFVLFLKQSWNTGLSMYHTVMANMGYHRFTALLEKMPFSHGKSKKKRVFMIEPVAKYIGDASLWISTPKQSLGAKLLYKNILSVSVETFIAHNHKTLWWISILVTTFHFYMLWLQNNSSYFIPVSYVYINKRKKHVWTVFHKYI